MEQPPEAEPAWSRGAALVVAATFAFALMALFSRSADAPVLAVAAWRAVFVALAFGAWAAWEGGVAALKPAAGSLRLGASYGLALAVASSTFVGGYALTTVANTVFLHSLAPLFVFPLAWWAFGERPVPRALFGTGIAVLGVALLSGVSIFHVSRYTDTRFLVGDLLALVSAAGYALVLVATRAARKASVPVVPTLFVAWTVAAAVLCALALAMGQLALPPRAIGWVFALAIVSTNVPFFLLSLGMKTVGAGLTSLLAMAEVVFATAIGLAVYGESLAPIGWVGAALVVAGIAHPFLRESPENAENALPEVTGRARGLRLGLRLLLLNAGAGFALVGGAEAGVLLAWVAVASSLRLGPVLLGPGGWARRWAPPALALVVLVGLAARGGWNEGAPSLPLALVAVLAWLVDGVLARQEEGPEADPDRAGGAALLLLAAGTALARGGHGGGGVLLLAAALVAGSIAGSTLLGRGLGGRLDDMVSRLSRPRLLVPAVAVVLLAGGVTVVPTGHVGVLERLGTPVAEPVPAGLALRLPPPLERLTLVNVATVRRSDLARSSTPLLTADGALVSLDVAVYWTVDDPLRFALHVAEPESALASLARAALVQTVARLPLDTVLTDGRDTVEAQVAAAAQVAANSAGLGMRVDAVQLAAVAVPAPVQAAFLDVISAGEHKRELINEAEAYEARVVPSARGTAVSRVEAARGEAAGLLVLAEARHGLVGALSTGGQASPSTTRTRLWREQVTDALEGHALVLAPRSIHVWLGGGAESALPGPKPSTGGSRDQ